VEKTVDDLRARKKKEEKSKQYAEPKRKIYDN
jgi:hypothetical protein